MPEAVEAVAVLTVFPGADLEVVGEKGAVPTRSECTFQGRRRGLGVRRTGSLVRVWAIFAVTVGVGDTG